jgi:AraC-like DNA-binding protein
MRDTHGCIEISELSADLGYCRKHLVSLFQREIGLSPKAFARVLRFSQALRRVRSSNQPQWDELALDCGYFDQSHLIREFQAYTGHSPGSFYRQPALDDESIHQQRGAE